MSGKMVYREAGGEGMLYDPERDELHVLNETARLIHRLAGEGLDPDAIAAALRERFAVPAEVDLRAAVEACLADLRGKGLRP